MQPIIVGVRFSKIGKAYHFDASKIQNMTLGDTVVVETSRGWQVGEVCEIVKNVENIPEGSLKSIERRATPRDLVIQQLHRQKEQAVVETCRQRVAQLNLQGIKVILAEYSFDGARLTIHYSSESEDRIELKSLRPDMQKQYGPAQVELRQIGPRDVAKFLGGMGACGIECRCCSRFITDFNSISIKMAKEQGISLTPSEITGMCGRLRCCLHYEYEFYHEARSRMPKRNKWVKTPSGEGRVVDVLPLRESVLVEIPENGVREFPMSEIVVMDDVEENQRKENPQRQPEKNERKFTGGNQRRR
jgi:cell fate regulator YaaT (PSP1 superfamily)